MIVKNLFEKFSNLWEYLIESLLNLLYATTAGIAAKRPRAVANSASAIPAVVAYNKFNNDSIKYFQRLENFSKRFLTII